jgi:beta-mannosidase
MCSFSVSATNAERKYLKVAYTDCSTTHGVLSLDPYVLRFANGTPGYIYGNSGKYFLICSVSFRIYNLLDQIERYNYDASEAFDLTTYPVARLASAYELLLLTSNLQLIHARFVNEFGYHSMPSFYTWEEVLQSPEDFSFDSTVVMSRDHHPPAGDLT